MLGALLNQTIDSQFLAREVDELISYHNKLKEEIGNKQDWVNSLISEGGNLGEEILELKSERTKLLLELKELGEIETVVKSKTDVIKYLNSKILYLDERIKPLLKQKSTLENNIQELTNTLQVREREVKSQIDKFRSKEIKAVELELSQIDKTKSERLKAIDLELSQYRESGFNRIKTEMGVVKEDTLQALKAALDTRKSALEAEVVNKEQACREQLETLDRECSEAVEALKGSVRAWEERVEELEETYRQRKQALISEAKEIIDIEREKFLLERDRELNRIEQHRLQVEQSLTHDRNRILEQHKGSIIAPYLEQIQILNEELVKHHTLLAAKSGKSFDWDIKQIKLFMTKERNGRLEPQHMRVAGESESGKSHLINEFITKGLQYFGIEANYEILDPFPSQTEWKVTPKISNDSEGALLRLKYWAEKSDDESEGLDRPMIIVIDEIDRMILKYKGDMVSCIRSIWGGGRHKSIFLWALGQNANVKKLSPLDWSDLDNASQIYLNSSCLQFIKNGLEGQNTKQLEGELKHIKTKAKYYSLVKIKGNDPYAVSRPFELFPSKKDTKALPSASTNSSQALACSHCGSGNVAKDGTLKGRQRVKCADCGKRGYPKGH